MVLLLTGATGFLGQAVYREWVEERPKDRIVVLVRPLGTQRFLSLNLPHSDLATVVEADFEHERLGIDEATTNTITHIVHCIGLTRFDASPETALKVNVHIARKVALFAAAKCTKLERFVYVSTAYVHPHDTQITNLDALVGPSMEAPTEDRAKKAWRATRAHHFNTYTWSKAISEHVVTKIIDAKNSSGSRLSIVRPSIIGPAWSKPESGWCVAKASPPVVAGIMVGTGLIKVGMVENVRLNIVPVDIVAARTVKAALGPPRAFHHVVVPPTKETRISECYSFYRRHFGETPEIQYRELFWFYADLSSYAVFACLSYWLEDAHAYFWSWFNPSLGKLMTTAINVKNVMFRTYGENLWHFGNIDDDLRDVRDVEYRQRLIVISATGGRDEVVSKMKNSKAPARIGHYVEVFLTVALLAFVALSVYAVQRLQEYCRNLSLVEPYTPRASFEFTLVGGSMFGLILDSDMVIQLMLGSVLLYAVVLAAAYEMKKQKWVDGGFVKRWRYRHNVALSLFSWFIAFAYWGMTFSDVGFTLDIHRITCGNPHNSSGVYSDVLQCAWILSKAWEWIDTVFLIWTDHTPIALHLWHHASTMALFMLLTVYPESAKLGPMWNGLIHGIMYWHYAKPFPRHIRPFMTTAQLVQFGLGAYMGWYGFYCGITERAGEMEAWTSCQVIVMTYVVLFGNFFMKQYL